MWKDVVGFEGKYQINEYGVVKSLKRTTVGEKQIKQLKEKILKPANSGKGYLSVCLRDGLSTHRKYIHRMVAECFVPNKNPSFTFVNHIDGNKRNNHCSNLEWCNCSQNNIHAYNNGLKCRGESFYNAKLTEESVKEILKNGKIGTYQSIADIYGVTKATIRDILTGKTWKHINNTIKSEKLNDYPERE